MKGEEGFARLVFLFVALASCNSINGETLLLEQKTCINNCIVGQMEKRGWKIKHNGLSRYGFFDESGQFVPLGLLNIEKNEIECLVFFNIKSRLIINMEVLEREQKHNKQTRRIYKDGFKRGHEIHTLEL